MTRPLTRERLDVAQPGFELGMLFLGCRLKVIASS